MNKNIDPLIIALYKKCELEVSEFMFEMEAKAYDACQYNLNKLRIISRRAKITPKKVGQFVTFWKRNENGPIEPFKETDLFDFYVVNVRRDINFGQFVFPKYALIKNGIISTRTKEGKRGFRVYPNWDITKSKQAEQTQKWQLKYFYEINKLTDFNRVKEMYNNK